MFTEEPGLNLFLVLIKRPESEKFEDIPLYSSSPHKNVKRSRFIIRLPSRLSAIFNYFIYY
jgi:hypothetical protein